MQFTATITAIGKDALSSKDPMIILFGPEATDALRDVAVIQQFGSADDWRDSFHHDLRGPVSHQQFEGNRSRYLVIPRRTSWKANAECDLSQTDPAASISCRNNIDL